MLVSLPLLVVADGIGGQEAGEVASRIAVETMEDTAPMFFDVEQLGTAVEYANQAVLDGVASGRGRPGMGTTLTAAVIEGDKLAVAQVGDSRAYRYRDGRLEQLTHDHSLVAAMVESGQLTEEEAREHPSRSIITRALGSDPDMKPDLFEFDLKKGDRVLLCSDGLSSMVTDQRIANVLSKKPNPQEAADELVEVAKDAGGLDNITVIVANIADATPVDEVKRTRSRKLSVIVFSIIAAVLVVLACTGFFMYAKNSAYLIDQEGYVALYSGRIDGIAGINLSWYETTTDIQTTLLPDQTRDSLVKGIQFDSMEKAKETIESYRTQSAQIQAERLDKAQTQAQVQAQKDAEAAARAEQCELYRLGLLDYEPEGYEEYIRNLYGDGQ